MTDLDRSLKHWNDSVNHHVGESLVEDELIHTPPK